MENEKIILYPQITKISPVLESEEFDNFDDTFASPIFYTKKEFGERTAFFYTINQSHFLEHFSSIRLKFNDSENMRKTKRIMESFVSCFSILCENPEEKIMKDSEENTFVFGKKGRIEFYLNSGLKARVFYLGELVEDLELHNFQIEKQLKNSLKDNVWKTFLYQKLVYERRVATEKIKYMQENGFIQNFKSDKNGSIMHASGIEQSYTLFFREFHIWFDGGIIAIKGVLNRKVEENFLLKLDKIRKFVDNNNFGRIRFLVWPGSAEQTEGEKSEKAKQLKTMLDNLSDSMLEENSTGLCAKNFTEFNKNKLGKKSISLVERVLKK